MNKKEFIVARVSQESEEGFAYMDPYNGNLSFFSTIENSTRLGSIDEAREIVQGQEALARILKREDTFKILEIETSIKEIENK
ncbi:hypothetical protein [uncultured Anaerococcus sp.]|uniref:hypothetical protein n=1 Tax=uncultured Anaerococcus sp. TaxID=293428 RepID=UPI00288AE83B|nr:hypothetical protein [uncultured Anaerococcus sp.]